MYFDLIGERWAGPEVKTRSTNVENRDYQAFHLPAWFLHILLDQCEYCGARLGAAEFIRQEGNELTGKIGNAVRMSNRVGDHIEAKWER